MPFNVEGGFNQEGGSGILVTGATPLYSYEAINAIINVGGALSVIGSVASYNYHSLPGDIVLSGEIAVDGSTPAYSYSAVNAIISIGKGQIIGVVAAGFKQETITVNFKE